MSPPPPVRPPPQRAALPAKKLSSWALLFRFIIVVLMAGSIVFAWWTYSQRLVPLQRQGKDLSASLNRLIAEIDVIERKWPTVEREQIRTQYPEVRNQLFEGEAELGRWLDRLEVGASPLALDIKVDF